MIFHLFYDFKSGAESITSELLRAQASKHKLSLRDTKDTWLLQKKILFGLLSKLRVNFFVYMFAWAQTMSLILT
jgi:hypothetical protein